MGADFTIVSGDTLPSLGDTLSHENGEPINLTGCEVRFTLRSMLVSEPVKLTGKVTVVSAPAGEVAYIFSEADTGEPGYYIGSWTIVFPTGQQMTLSTVGYLWIYIKPNLKEIPAQIVSLPEVLNHLFIPASDRTHDDSFLTMIGAVRPLIENLVGPLLPTVYDEWYEGGHSTLTLRHKPSFGYGTTPIFNVMAVSEYRGPIEYNLSIVGTPTQGSVYSTMAHAELGQIVRRTSGGGTYAFWRDKSHPAQSIHVLYQVGQEKIPDNIRMAALEAIRWWYETTEAVGKGSLVQADAEPIRPMAALPYHVTSMLAPQRRYPALA